MDNCVAPEVYRTKEEIQRFFDIQGIGYLERPETTWTPLLSMQLDGSEYYRANREEFEKLSSAYSQDIEQCRIAPVYIQKIDQEIGYGVFAAEDMEQNDFVGEYTGMVQVAREESGREMEDGGYESDFSWYYLDAIEGGPVLEINGLVAGNEMRFVNHSATPNVDVEHMLHRGLWVIFFKAARDIKRGEQILISYGEGYWEQGYRDPAAL